MGSNVAPGVSNAPISEHGPVYYCGKGQITVRYGTTMEVHT